MRTYDSNQAMAPALKKNSKQCRASNKQTYAFIDHFKQIVISGIGKLIKFVCNLHDDQKLNTGD